MSEDKKAKSICQCCRKCIHYACCCCILSGPLKFCCFGKSKCKLKNCNDKFGFIIFVSLYVYAISIWYDAIKQNGLAGIEYVNSANLENQIKQLSGKSSLSIYYDSISDQLTSLYADLNTSLATIGLSVGCSIIISQIYVFLLSIDKFRGLLRKMALVQVFVSGKSVLIYVIFFGFRQKQQTNVSTNKYLTK